VKVFQTILEFNRYVASMHSGSPPTSPTFRLFNAVRWSFRSSGKVRSFIGIRVGEIESRIGGAALPLEITVCRSAGLTGMEQNGNDYMKMIIRVAYTKAH